MSREDVRRLMPGAHASFRKGPNAEHETDAFFNGGFQIFYEGNPPTVEYIELVREFGFKARYQGADVFAMQAEELLAYVGKYAAFDPNDPELGYSYFFPELELSLWRPIMPASPDDDEGQYFTSIGIGVRGYFSASPL
jgi:hypothetical protein